jgi:hypothetical protein
MKLEIKTNFSFKKLENYVKRKGFGFRLSRAAAPFIVNDSKNFIREGKVTPDIEEITKDIKRRRGSPTPDIPLMDTGNLVKSLKATITSDSVAISGASYGLKHLQGDGVEERNFIDLSDPNGKGDKLLSEEFKKLNKAMKK